MGKKAKELNVRLPVIREFPKDQNYWWIRWVDGYHDTHPAAPQPKVGVHLERLDVDLRHVIRRENAAVGAMKRDKAPPSDQVTRRVSIGNISELAIGGIYHRGIRVGMMGLAQKRFEFDLVRSPPRLVRFYDTCLEPPEWWDPEYTHRVVNRREYRIPRKKSWGVMLSTPDESLILLIPCHEVFRYFYAKQSKMARALLSGPWEVTRSQVVNPDRTVIREDGDWQVVLRNGMREDSMFHAANLALHREGTLAAKRIYSALMEDGSPWHVRAEIPFAPHKFRIRGRFLALRDDDGYKKLLCTQILSVHWPHSNPIHFIRENDPSAGAREHDTDDPVPFGAYSIELSGMDEYHVENTSWEDPTFRGPAITHSAPGSVWVGLPPVRKMTKEESYRYRRPNQDPEQQPASSTSAREPSHSDSSATVGSFDMIGGPKEHLVERFAKVLELFDQLKNCGYVCDWQALPPTGEAGRFVLEGEPVWPLPTFARNEKGVTRKRPWAIVDKSTGRPRCVLIARLTISGGPNIYWLEVEPSIPHDQEADDQGGRSYVRARGFRSLILSAGYDTREIEPTLKAALALCVRCRGIWPDLKEIVQFTGAGAANCWIHHHLGTGELSINSACKAINEVSTRS